ncbi:uncharacterized protein OCT59_019007 [Rhizophagus irregularis]|uniref:uncharacterized protein n=1 Tax=Rhizophagus irregularis TaxID=588596 RepID=UPI003316E4C1|nr:hypothetical protein OCT59_019007 [Rhizophagus irregularis]
MRLYLLVSVYQNGKQIVKSSAISIEPPGLLSDLLKLALSTNDIPNANISVDFQKDNSKDWHIILKGIQENLEILIFLKATHIRFIWNDDYDDINNSQAEIHKNAFNILMSNATNIHLPLAQGLTTRNNLLYNHVIDLLRIQKLGWFGNAHTTSGVQFVSRLSNLIWYIDPHRSKFIQRSYHFPKFIEELPEYKASSSYNQYYNNSHHKKIEIQAKTLKRHVEALEKSLIQPWASDKKWEQFIDEVIQLCATSKKYVEYLDNVNNRMRIIHSSSIPIRNGIDHIKVLLDINKTSSMSNKYTDIINLMQDKAEYDPICIDDLIPHNVFQAAYLEGMELPFNITLYRYYSGNYIGTLNWIWKRPDTVELFDKTKESQSLLKAHKSLPKYSTRQMRKNVINKYSLYTRLSPAILCTLYQDLTGNAISNSNLISQEVQERIKLMYETQDPNIVFDLRKNGGFKGTKFDEFWNEMDAYFNEIVLAVHDQRHTSNLYMPVAISIQELREKINNLFDILKKFENIHSRSKNPQISSDPDHYQDFNSLYGRNTTEIDLPSKKNNLVCQELAPDGMLVAARVRDFALCTSCTKLRCIFSKYVLRESDSEILQTAMETFAYIYMWFAYCSRKSSFI